MHAFYKDILANGNILHSNILTAVFVNALL